MTPEVITTFILVVSVILVAFLSTLPNKQRVSNDDISAIKRDIAALNAADRTYIKLRADNLRIAYNATRLRLYRTFNDKVGIEITTKEGLVLNEDTGIRLRKEPLRCC
jgi:hypothetical protein